MHIIMGRKKKKKKKEANKLKKKNLPCKFHRNLINSESGFVLFLTGGQNVQQTTNTLLIIKIKPTSMTKIHIAINP